MKKTYKKPLAVNYDLGRCVFPAALAIGGALVGGYALGRTVAKALEAAPIIKLKTIER